MTLNKIETKAVKFIALDTNLNSNTKSITLLALKQIENSY